MASKYSWNEYKWGGDWTVVGDSDDRQALQAVRSSWWGQAGRDRLSQVQKGASMRIFPPDIVDSLGLLEYTAGLIVARGELFGLYDRACELFSLNSGGIVLTGQPGTGKSYSLAFLLVCCMAHERPVMLSTRYAETYLFTGGGIYARATEALTGSALPRAYPFGQTMKRVWSLIDSTSEAVPPRDVLTGSTVFPIHATSPKVSRYKAWKKHNLATTIYMPVWSLQDLLQSVRMHTRFLALPTAAGITDASISDAVRNSAPCPRDVFMFLLDSTSYNAARTAAVQAIKSLRDLDSMLESVTSGQVSATDVSHTVFLVDRAGFSASTSDDIPRIDFKNDIIADELCQRFALLQFKEARDLYRKCTSTPEASVLAGWIFESIGVRVTSGDSATPDGIIGSFSRMHLQTLKPDSKLPLLYVDYTHFSATAVIPSFYCQTAKGTVLLDPATHSLRYKAPTSQAALLQLPIAARTLEIFSIKGILHMSIESNKFYVPDRRNNPLFDAFFVEQSLGSLLTIWILQFTISRRHGGSGDGIAVVKHLRENLLKQPGTTVELKWVLVVPRKDGVPSGWQLPAHWFGSKVDGEVYVQYLNVKEM